MKPWLLPIVIATNVGLLYRIDHNQEHIMRARFTRAGLRKGKTRTHYTLLSQPNDAAGNQLVVHHGRH